ncbi:MAG: tetratricopeptide repeat protein [Bacteroidota bacterium]
MLKKILQTITLVVIIISITAAEQQPDSIKTAIRNENILQLGMKYYFNAKYDSAISALNVAASDSTFSPALFYIGASYEALNDYQNAKQYYTKAVESDSCNSPYRFRLAKLLEVTGSMKDAENELAIINDQDSAFIPAFFEGGILSYNRRDYDRAIQLFSHVLRTRSNDFLSYYYIGSSYIIKNKMDSARTKLSECLMLNPEYVPALNALASIYFSNYDYREALHLYTRAMNLRPELGDYYYKAGLCHSKLEEYKESIHFFTEATRRDTTNDSYYAQMGYAYLMMEQFDSSVAAYLNAIAIDKENPLYLTNLGFAYSKLDSVDRAASSYEQAITVQKPQNIALMYIRLGTLYYYNEDYKKALAAYQKAATLDPANKDAQFYSAITYDRQKDPKSAIRHYKKFLDLTSGDTIKQDWQNEAKKRLSVLKKLL